MKRFKSVKVFLFIFICVLFFVSGQTAVNADSFFTKEELENKLEVSLMNTFSDYTLDDSSNWYNIYDLNGEFYAYFAKLLDKYGTVKGYTIPNIITGSSLVSLVGQNAEDFAAKVSDYADSKSISQLVYEYPNLMLLRSSIGLIEILDDGSLIEVRDTKTLFSGTVDLLKKSNSINKESIESTKGSSYVLYGSLDDWEWSPVAEFVPVELPSGAHYYGGKQSWLEDEGVSSFYANRACGTAAAANAMQYMSEHVVAKGNLYDKSDLSKSNYSEYQKEVFDIVRPGILGFPNTYVLSEYVEDYAISKNAYLSEAVRNTSWTEINIIDYISAGLNFERPVLLLTWNNSSNSALSYHWVTVTRLYRGAGETNIMMVTSNHGALAEYDFTVWVNSSSIHKDVVYFN